MINIDLSDKTVLITGGTCGIGRATALQFGKAGAGVFLTYKWGTADEQELYSDFEAVGAKRPVLIQADVSVDEDTDRLMETMGERVERVDVFISNVGFAQRTMNVDEYKKRSLFKTLEYSTWPFIEYSRRIKMYFKSYPQYVIGISSDGPDHFYQGYDFVAASKALLEFFCRYLSVHLSKEGSRVNVIRFGNVRTESFGAIFGEEFFKYLKENGVSESMILTPEECGKAVLALCSGLLNAVNGQVLSIDYGLPFRDNAMMRYLATLSGKPSG